MTEQEQMEQLCSFLEGNNFNLIILEGPRGAGKSTFCDKLTSRIDVDSYKTWGQDQKWVRHKMQSSLDLDLPQGTYFVLDFLAQVKHHKPILADRGNLSAIAYQRDLPYSLNPELHKYYVDLMTRVRAVMLVLEAPIELITERRIAREDKDEQALHNLPPGAAKSIVSADVGFYEEAISKMERAGLRNVTSYDVGGDITCWCYVSEFLDVLVPEEELYGKSKT